MVVVAALVAAGGCGDDENDPAPAKVVAFLRAVATEQRHQDAFLGVLRRAGYVEGRNLTVLAGDPTETHVEPDDVARTLAEWQQQGVDLIVAQSSAAALAARDAGGHAAILFISSAPEAAGLVDDERSPDGRLTGVAFRVPADRTLDVTRRALPSLRTVAFLYPPTDPPAAAQVAAMEEAARVLDLQLVPVPFSDEAEIAARLAGVVGDAHALVIASAPSAVRAYEQVETASRAARIPVVANTDVADFAILVLQPDVPVLWQQLGRQAARLLGGAEPAGVPVEGPAAFRLVVNLRAAAELAIELPAALVDDADSVIR